MDELVECMLFVGFRFVLDNWLGLIINWLFILVYVFIVVFYIVLLEIGWEVV